MEKPIKMATQILLVLVPLAGLTFFIEEELYRTLIREDGWIEYLTAMLLLITCLLLVAKVAAIGNTRGRIWLVANILLALGLFFGFGEELSWGQRIFDVQSNDFFREYNAQGETNLHNLMIGGIKINRWIFSYAFTILFGCYFLLLLQGYTKIDFVRKAVDGIDLPVPRASQSLVFLAITMIIMLIPDGKKWELWECLFAITLLSVFVEPHNTNAKLVGGRHVSDA